MIDMLLKGEGNLKKRLLSIASSDLSILFLALCAAGTLAYSAGSYANTQKPCYEDSASINKRQERMP